MYVRTRTLAGRFLLALGGTTLVLGSLPAGAADPGVGLGTAESYAVLAGSAITNTGPSVITGDVGVAPGTAISGFPPGIINGTVHSADAAAAEAKDDTVTAYNDAAGRTPFTAVATELGGRVLQPGVYRNATLGLTGTLTLDAAGDPNAVFVLQSASTLITASQSRVVVINGAQACNVFWQVGSSATLGTTTTFVGTVLALTSITANNGATVQGRLLARNGAVTLDNNRITRTTCATAVVPTTTTTTTTPATTTTTTTAAPSTAPSAPVPTTAAPTANPSPDGPDAPVTAGGPDAPVTADGSNPAAPAGVTGGGDVPGVVTPQRGPDGGDDSSTPITRLPRTGVGVPGMAAAGVLAILLGVSLIRQGRGRWAQ